MKSSISLGRGLALICFAFTFFVCADVSRADDAPAFGDPAATAFAKDYIRFVDEYTAFVRDYKAVIRNGDDAKMKAETKKELEFQAKLLALQSKGAEVQGKLKPEDAKKFSDFMQACLKKMTDALREGPTSAPGTV